MGEQVFLDASFWIAYRRKLDPNAERASEVLKKLFARRPNLVTTFPVVCEIQAYFARHPRLKYVVLNDLWQNPVLLIEEITFKDQERAVEILRSHRDKSYSLCDALSFVVMERLGIKKAASFDAHFRQFGEFEIID